MREWRTPERGELSNSFCSCLLSFCISNYLLYVKDSTSFAGAGNRGSTGLWPRGESGNKTRGRRGAAQVGLKPADYVVSPDPGIMGIGWGTTRGLARGVQGATPKAFGVAKPLESIGLTPREAEVLL